MTTIPRVSVLMSVYNGARYLREAVDSILGQSFGDFEFIIVDDGSSDETPAILDSYADPRIVRLHNETNIGLTRSLNKGLAAARGEYVARQDADDISLPERLAKQVAYLDTHPQIALVGSAYREVYEDGRPERPVSVPLAPVEIRQQLLYQHCFCHGAVLMRRAALAQVGGYDERFVVAQDRDLWLRLADNHQLANLTDEMYRLRMSSRSVTGKARARQRQAARQAVIEALTRGLLKPAPQALGRFHWLQVLAETDAGNVEAAGDFLRQAMAANPQLAEDAPWLARTAVHHAFELSHAGQIPTPEYDAGFTFLQNLVELLPTDGAVPLAWQEWMRGELSAACAFAAARSGDGARVRRFCLRAWRAHRAPRRNRGLLAVFLRSFTLKPAMATPTVL